MMTQYTKQFLRRRIKEKMEDIGLDAIYETIQKYLEAL